MGGTRSLNAELSPLLGGASLTVVYTIANEANTVIRAIKEIIPGSILGLHTKEEECHVSDELTTEAR